MTNYELLKLLTREAKDYRKGCVDSINRNKHMNRCNGQCNVSQDDIDAILVDFINTIAGRRRIDYSLYTQDVSL